jgi:hypothetical protein
MNFMKYNNNPHMSRNLQPNVNMSANINNQPDYPSQGQAMEMLGDDRRNQMVAQQQIQNMPNPFQDPNFSNSLPDIPIQDSGAALMNALMNDDTVPTKIKDEFWFVFHRDNILTFLDETRKKMKMLSFDILKIDSLNATPYYEYTFDKEFKWNSARQMLETKLDRALGNKKGVNERLAIPMTITENVVRNEDNTMNGNQKEGFLRRILSRK